MAEQRQHKKSPLQTVRESYGSKSSLVTKVLSLVDRKKGEGKEEHKTRFTRLSNRKLMRVLQVQEEIKRDFGSREEMARQLLAMQRKGSIKDKDYLEKLMTYSDARLLSTIRAEARKQVARKGSGNP